MIQDRTCRACGKTFPGGPRAYYCPGCRAVRKREQTEEYKKRKRNGEVREIGSTDQCERCGKDYEVKSGLQRFCEECQPIHCEEYDRETSIQFYRENKDRINPPRKIKRRKRGNICKICDKEFEPVNGSVTCSDECRRKLNNQQGQSSRKRLKERNAHPEEWYDLTSIAAEIGKSKATLSDRYRRGGLPTPDIYTPSGRPRWYRSTIMPYIKSNNPTWRIQRIGLTIGSDERDEDQSY